MQIKTLIFSQTYFGNIIKHMNIELNIKIETEK